MTTLLQLIVLVGIIWSAIWIMADGMSGRDFQRPGLLLAAPGVLLLGPALLVGVVPSSTVVLVLCSLLLIWIMTRGIDQWFMSSSTKANVDARTQALARIVNKSRWLTTRLDGSSDPEIAEIVAKLRDDLNTFDGKDT